MIEEDGRRSSLERADAAASRGHVDAHLPFRSRVLDQFFLFEPGDRATVTLLMRGMPVPVTFGFPDTDGTIGSNAVAFARNFHPAISIFAVHPLCPFAPKERAVVFFCSVAFNFLWTAFTAYHERRVEGRIRDDLGYRYIWFYALVKHAVTVAYAVAIRQIVICPCLYAPLLRAAVDDEAPPRELLARADRLIAWKERGDRVILILALGHAALIAGCVYELTANNWLDGYENPKRVVLSRILASEALNFVIWFPKFAPVFLFLYPIHRAMWYQRGSYADYLARRKPLLLYRRTGNYCNATYARCVKPETKRVKGGSIASPLRSVSGRYAMSTIRRDDAPRSDLSSTELRSMPDCRGGGDPILPQPTHQL